MAYKLLKRTRLNAIFLLQTIPGSIGEVQLEVQHPENEKLQMSLSAFFASSLDGKSPCVGPVPCPAGHPTSGTPRLPVHNGRWPSLPAKQSDTSINTDGYGCDTRGQGFLPCCWHGVLHFILVHHQLAFSITIRVENPIIHDPIMPVIRINMQAVNHCDASD